MRNHSSLGFKLRLKPCHTPGYSNTLAKVSGAWRFLFLKATVSMPDLKVPQNRLYLPPHPDFNPCHVTLL